MKHATIVVTDSGGIQPESTRLGTRWITARENTKGPVTVAGGTKMVAGSAKQGIKNAFRRQMARKSHGCVLEDWKGRAASRMVEALMSANGSHSAFRPCTSS